MRTLVTLLVTVAAALGPAGAAGALAPAAPVRGVGGYHVAGVMHEKGTGPPSAKPTVVYRDLNLPSGQTATVFSNGIAEVFSAGHRSAQYRMVASAGVAGSGTTALPSRGQLIWELSRAPASPYVPGTVEVVLARGVSATGAARTTSAPLNRLLAGLGTDAMSAVFGGRAPPAGATTGLDLRQAFVMHVTGATVPAAVT